MQVKMATKSGEGVAERIVLRLRPEDMAKVKAMAGDTPIAVFIRRCVAERLAAYSEQRGGAAA